ncbi:MAG: DUF4834 family protein [Bacteroidaceae bacterium]
MHLLFGLLFFILFIVLMIGLSIVSTVWRLFSGAGRSKRQSVRQEDRRTDDSYAESPHHSSGSHKKVFEADEGEYVDFEEIPD